MSGPDVQKVDYIWANKLTMELASWIRAHDVWDNQGRLKARKRACSVPVHSGGSLMPFSFFNLTIFLSSPYLRTYIYICGRKYICIFTSLLHIFLLCLFPFLIPTFLVFGRFVLVTGYFFGKCSISCFFSSFFFVWGNFLTFDTSLFERFLKAGS